MRQLTLSLQFLSRRYSCSDECVRISKHFSILWFKIWSVSFFSSCPEPLLIVQNQTQRAMQEQNRPTACLIPSGHQFIAYLRRWMIQPQKKISFKSKKQRGQEPTGKILAVLFRHGYSYTRMLQPGSRLFVYSRHVQVSLADVVKNSAKFRGIFSLL